MLTSAEASGDNRHFLLWYQGNQPAGFVQFLKEDVSLFRASGLSDGLRVLGCAQRLSPYPKKDEVFALIKELAPDIHGKLGKDTGRVRLTGG
jgi:hypothetical protein